MGFYNSDQEIGFKASQICVWLGRNLILVVPIYVKPYTKQAVWKWGLNGYLQRCKKD